MPCDCYNCSGIERMSCRKCLTEVKRVLHEIIKLTQPIKANRLRLLLKIKAMESTTLKAAIKDSHTKIYIAELDEFIDPGLLVKIFKIPLSVSAKKLARADSYFGTFLWMVIGRNGAELDKDLNLVLTP